MAPGLSGEPRLLSLLQREKKGPVAERNGDMRGYSHGLTLRCARPRTYPLLSRLAGEDDASSPHDPFNLAEHRGRRHDETVALEQPVMTEEIAHLPARTLAYGYGAERVP